jgi:hypothetical protein
LGLPVTAPNSTAKTILLDQLRQWGLEELSGDLDRLIKDGLDAPAITIQLSETAAYKSRFAANEIRRQKGLPVLNPAEYVATEQAYQQVLRTYGLPHSFYDDRSDFHGFIGNDLAPDELNERAQVAQQVWLSNDDTVRDTWRHFYGLSDGAAIASILDPDRALPIVQRMANAARFGAAASRQGLNADRDRLEQYSDLGITESAVADAFGKIAATKPADDRIAQRFGSELTQADREREEVLGNADAARKRSSLYQSETALFQGKASAGEGALSRTRGGSF